MTAFFPCRHSSLLAQLLIPSFMLISAHCSGLWDFSIFLFIVGLTRFSSPSRILLSFSIEIMLEYFQRLTGGIRRSPSLFPRDRLISLFVELSHNP